MGTFWEVTVLEKTGEWIDLCLVVNAPQAPSFAEDPVFALELLTDLAYECKIGHAPVCALGRAIEFDLSILPKDLKGRVDEFIKSVIVYYAKNLDVDDIEEAEKIENQMISEGLKQSTPEWDIVWADRWNARWHEDENVPTAKYRIYVTDPKWIEHLSPGQTFDTAAYSDAGPWVCEDRSIEL